MTSGFGDVETVEVNGTSLAYQEQGEGDGVVLVHGSFSDLRSWEPQLEPLGRSHRSITYSRRYSPPNEPIPEGVDDQMAPHVEDLIEFLPAVGADPAHLVGNSFGAFVSLLTVIRRPDQVRSLVLGEPPAITLFVSMPPRPAEMARLLLRRPRTAVAIAGLGGRVIAPAEKAFRRGDDEKGMAAFAGGILGKRRFEAMPESRKAQARENVAPLKASLLGAGFPHLDESDLRDLSVPVLLLEGEHTHSAFRRVLDRLEELIPSAERKVLPDATHTQEENPGAMSEILSGWISRH